MKIFEIFSPNSEEAFSPSYDLGDDLQYFMNNDPEFYRKNYYPFVMRVKEAKVNKTKFTAKAFEAIVNHAYKVYKETLCPFAIKETGVRARIRNKIEICKFAAYLYGF